MSVEFLLTSLVVILIPGTGAVYTIVAGLSFGRRSAVFAAIGCILSIAPHIAASALGLAAILHTSALVFQVLKFAGVAYLLYLAYQTLRDAGPLRLDKKQGDSPPVWGIVRTGILINVLNPKLSLFFMAFLPQFVSTSGDAALAEMIGLGGLFMAMTFLVFVLYGWFAALAGGRILGNDRVLKWMRRTTAVAFAGFGLRLAFSDR